MTMTPLPSALQMYFRQVFNFAAAFSHPAAQLGCVELVPTRLLRALANPEPRQTGELADGTVVDLKAQWDDIVRTGMKKPFFIAAGRDGFCRLAGGNRRVVQFDAHNVPLIPAAVIVADSCLLPGFIGEQKFIRPMTLAMEAQVFSPSDSYTYMKPSDAFPEIAEMKRNGLLLVP